MQKFYGRKEEMDRLSQIVASDTPRLIAVHGRRRAGKTSLVEHVLKEKFLFFKLEGLEDAASHEQIRTSYHDLNSFFGKSFETKKTWAHFFDDLYSVLKEVKEPLIVFVDEFQWLANMRTTLVSIFKKYWDNKFSKLTNCHFIICGSISSFIVKKVVRSKALYGRIDCEISLGPLSLEEVSNFFPDRTPRNEILEAYMTFGGIPKYYEVYDFDLSLKQNYEQLFFKKGGYFFQEIAKLFVSHFGKNSQYRQIVEALVSGMKTKEDLERSLKVSSGGTFSTKVSDLVLAGFIREVKAFGSRKLLYSIADPYLRFYFTFVEPNIESIVSGQYNFYRDGDRKLASWYGLAFENFCLSNSKKISDVLLFSGVSYVVAPYRKISKDSKGCQIDLLFKRDDRTITVCELKYSQNLDMSKIIEEFKVKESILVSDFPRDRIHRVFISGHKMSDTEKKKALSFFHSVMDCEELI